jgi:hypothetical protein
MTHNGETTIKVPLVRCELHFSILSKGMKVKHKKTLSEMVFSKKSSLEEGTCASAE